MGLDHRRFDLFRSPSRAGDVPQKAIPGVLSVVPFHCAVSSNEAHGVAGTSIKTNHPDARRSPGLRGAGDAHLVARPARAPPLDEDRHHRPPYEPRGEAHVPIEDLAVRNRLGFDRQFSIDARGISSPSIICRKSSGCDTPKRVMPGLLFINVARKSIARHRAGFCAQYRAKSTKIAHVRHELVPKMNSELLFE